MVAPNQIFDDNLLGIFRDIEARTRPATCSIIFPVAAGSSTISQGGAPTENSEQNPVVVSGVSCRISPSRIGGRETESAESLQSLGKFWVSLPWDVDTITGHHINEDCSILFEGTTYRIIDVKAPRTFRTKTRCLCEKVR